MFMFIRSRMSEQTSTVSPIGNTDTVTSEGQVDEVENIDVIQEPPLKRQHFQASSTTSGNEWELPVELNDYVKTSIKIFYKESELNESVFKRCPVPGNLVKVKKLDSSFKELLEEQHKRAILAQDEVLASIQSRLMSLYAPFGKLWTDMEADKDAIINPPEGTEKVLLTEDMTARLESTSERFEQSVTLIGQTMNLIYYHRRCAVLQAIFQDRKKARDILSDKREMLEEDDSYLFGLGFEEHVVKTQKTKIKTKEMLASSSSSKAQPFRTGPPSRGTYRGRGRSSFFMVGARGSSSNGNSSYFPRGKTFEFNYFISSGIFQSTSSSKSSLQKCHSPNTTSRENKILPEKLAKNNQGLSDSRSCARASDSLCRWERTSAEKTSKPITLEQNRTGDSGFRDSGLDKERCNREGEPLQRAVPEHYVCSKEKGWGSSPSDKFKGTEQPHSIYPFQNGGITPPQGSVEKRGYNGETRSQGCLFFSSSEPKVSKICKVSVEKQPLSVHLPLLWSGSSTQTIQQINESSNSHLKKVEYSAHHLFRRHVVDGGFQGGNSNGKGHTNLPSTESRFFDKCPKICVDSNHANRISRCNCEFSGNGVDFTIREKGEGPSPMLQ